MKTYALILTTLLGSACATTQPPLPTVAQVDLERFMGDWYVIAHIPTFIEKDAFNAIESYARNADGSIATTFRFRAGAFDGPEKLYQPTGYVRPETGNAVWGMQFIWPFKAEYLINRLNDDYSLVVIGRTARDYAWVMARTPRPPEVEVEAALAWLGEHGYELGQIRRVPHGP